MCTLYFFYTIFFSFCIYGQDIQPPAQEFIGVYNISRYYAPMPGQKRYYLGRTYEEDVTMNCGKGGDCLHTANGYELTEADTHRVVACPPEFPMGTRLYIQDVGAVVCQDRGGAIKKKRLDLWAGIWEKGMENVYRKAGIYSGEKAIYYIK